MGGHDHVSPHILGRSIENKLPKRCKNYVSLAYAGGGDGPDVAAENLGGHVGVPALAW